MAIKGIPYYIWKKLPVEIWYEIYLYVLYIKPWKIRNIPVELIWDFSISKTDEYTSLCYKEVALESLHKVNWHNSGFL
jgi:hypothetical protein